MPTEETFGPIQYPGVRMNLLAILEVFSTMGLPGVEIDDHLFSDCINDLPMSIWNEPPDASTGLGEFLITRSEAKILDNLAPSLRFAVGRESIEEVVQNPRLSTVRQYSRALLRLLVRDELDPLVADQNWPAVRTRGSKTLADFPDPQDSLPLDLI